VANSVRIAASRIERRNGRPNVMWRPLWRPLKRMEPGSARVGFVSLKTIIYDQIFELPRRSAGWLGNLMLDEDKIQEIAREVASANSVNVTSVSSSPTIDSEGHDALRITIVIKSGSESKIGGDAALDTLVGIKYRLRREGEERLAIVEYATKEELEAGGDP
jgi:hypothetical protein